MQERIIASFNKNTGSNTDYLRSVKFLKLEEVRSRITGKKVYTLTVEQQDAQHIPRHGYEIYQPRTNDIKLKRVKMESEEVIRMDDCYMWRLPWTVYYPPTKIWIPVLDSNIPMKGEFLYKVKGDTREEYEARVQGGRSLHENVILALSNPPYNVYTISQPLRRLLEQPLSSEPSAPPAIEAVYPSAPPAAVKPPTFVADIMKGDAIKNGQMCPISLETFTDVGAMCMTPCFHVFDRECLDVWIKNMYSCPVCKASCNLEDCV
jgi:hypothetical protein